MADTEEQHLRPKARPAREAVAEASGEVRPRLRPEHLGEPPGNVASAATRRDALDLSGPALIGLFHGPDGSSALLRLFDGRIVRVARGDEVAGTRITAIAEDSLRLQRDGEEVVLTLPG